MLEARARQLQADHVSEVTEKRVDVARLPEAGSSQLPRKAQAGVEPALGLSGRWARKLDKEKRVMQKRKQQLEMKLQQRAEQRARKQQLRMEPRLLSRELAARLQQWLLHTPGSPWEEQLDWLLQEAPWRLHGEEQGPADSRARTRSEGQQQRLLAFLQCCVLADQLALAHHVLVMQHGRARQQRGLTLPMYNTVLHGWARKVSGFCPGGGVPAWHRRPVAALRFQPLSSGPRVPALCYCFNNSFRLFGYTTKSHVALKRNFVKDQRRKKP